MAGCDTLSYASFHKLSEPTFVALLREILNDFRDTLIVGATFVSLYHVAKDVYTVSGDDQAGLRLHPHQVTLNQHSDATPEHRRNYA